MDITGLSYVFGLSTMFFGLMTPFFWNRGDRVHKLVAILTAALAVNCLKDFVCLYLGIFGYPFYWNLFTAIDMTTVPLYCFVLMELVSPGKQTVRMMVVQEIPFLVLPVIYMFTSRDLYFYSQIGLAALLGTYYLIRALIEIPRYHRHLKERYSNTESINLGWLRVIIFAFYAILCLWIYDCLSREFALETLHIVCSLVLWIFIAVFLIRHQSVINELADFIPDTSTAREGSADTVWTKTDNSLAVKIEKLFKTREVYLKPNLKLSDVAREIGSNRTYVSNYFNRDAATTFYDYVNSYRVDYACNLLAASELPIQEVAEKSGFSSASVLARVFVKHKGCTPSAYRNSQRN